MMVYLKNMAGFKMDFFKGMSYDDIRPIFEKHFNSNVAFLEKSEKELEEEASKALKRKNFRVDAVEDFKEYTPMDYYCWLKTYNYTELVEKVEDDKESEELKKCLKIIPDDGDKVTIDAKPLSSKSPIIVDYKIYKEGKKNYFQIFSKQM
nr:hypothetical protein [Tanacetum cinerariifolium]